MSPQQLTEVLRNFRTAKARCAYLESQLEDLNRLLRVSQGQMINDQISLSQAITGMPHGTNVGDPTGRLALDIASGKESVFVKQIQEEIIKFQAEMQTISPNVRVVEIVLNGLSERERIPFEMKMIDDCPWLEILARMNREYHNSYSKRSLQRLLDRAVEKAYKIVQ